MIKRKFQRVEITHIVRQFDNEDLQEVKISGKECLFPNGIDCVQNDLFKQIKIVGTVCVEITPKEWAFLNLYKDYREIYFISCSGLNEAILKSMKKNLQVYFN